MGNHGGIKWTGINEYTETTIQEHDSDTFGLDPEHKLWARYQKICDRKIGVLISLLKMLEFGPDAIGPGLDLLCIGTYSCALWAFSDHG